MMMHIKSLLKINIQWRGIIKEMKIKFKEFEIKWKSNSKC